ncbi:MAG: bifunctional 4-hydroxy-2-oxoglutarate aldolase/2-dehydro-3-deoxy-phosphogluconate aldolase [Firmicutes bacterium]|nr:bifunctional 4-hydroxy-2-oxoglutarate aldolase/2-dehydro-3-deoxy-phosphogluconate aldolase [Bacillota bacterium]
MRLSKGDLIAIARGVKSSQIVAIGETLLKAGFKYIEVSLSDEQEGIACIRELSRRLGGDSALRLGAGTVTRKDLVDRALEAGAEYIITPGWDRELIKYIIRKKVPVFPGVLTPSEVMQALNEGLTQVKLFPVGNLKPGYIKNLKGPFPTVEFIGVGGVDTETIGTYYHAGCFAFAIGADLIPRQADLSVLPQIEKKAKEYLAVMKSLCKQ